MRSRVTPSTRVYAYTWPHLSRASFYPRYHCKHIHLEQKNEHASSFFTSFRFSRCFVFEKYFTRFQFHLYSIQWRAEPGFEKNSKGEITDRFIYVKPKNVDRRKLIDVGVHFSSSREVYLCFLPLSGMSRAKILKSPLFFSSRFVTRSLRFCQGLAPHTREECSFLSFRDSAPLRVASARARGRRERLGTFVSSFSTV